MWTFIPFLSSALSVEDSTTMNQVRIKKPQLAIITQQVLFF